MIKLKANSFIIKILFFYILIIILFLIFIFIFSFKKLKNDNIKTVIGYLNNYSNLIEDEIDLILKSNSKEKLQNFINTKAKHLKVRITFIDMAGNVIVDSNENPSYMDNHFNRPEIEKALKGINNYSIRFSTTLKKNMLYYAYGLKINGKITGVLRFSVFIDEIDRMVLFLQIKNLILISFLILISITAILFIYFNFNKELKKFSTISKEVTKGNFNIQFPKNDSYEIRELGYSFKNMILKIKELIGELTFEKEELNSIISSIKEGIAVIDKKGKIIRINNSFQNIFKDINLKEKYYWEIIRDNETNEIIKNINNNENNIKEIEINEKIFLCSINYLKLKEEIVLFLYDVTDLRNYERIKKDLVTNVSHELGTPLTAIKGFVETLLDEENDEEKIKYLKIINRHTDRLNNIVKDLLSLSKLEDKQNDELFEEVNLKHVIEIILPLFTERIKEKNLVLNIIADDNNYLIKGDSFKLEQLFINLFDNSIKYTDKGEISIILSNLSNGVKAEIIDTGIGISDKDKSRIFERFYVADKSRSRSLGGTGLGLSIVKHIILLHKADIKVENNNGKGTKFTIFFPQV